MGRTFISLSSESIFILLRIAGGSEAYPIYIFYLISYYEIILLQYDCTHCLEFSILISFLS